MLKIHIDNRRKLLGMTSECCVNPCCRKEDTLGLSSPNFELICIGWPVAARRTFAAVNVNVVVPAQVRNAFVFIARKEALWIEEFAVFRPCEELWTPQLHPDYKDFALNLYYRKNFNICSKLKTFLFWFFIQYFPIPSMKFCYKFMRVWALIYVYLHKYMHVWTSIYVYIHEFISLWTSIYVYIHQFIRVWTAIIYVYEHQFIVCV